MQSSKFSLFVCLVGLCVFSQRLWAGTPLFENGSYTTFSVTYNGQRYYLGVDTTSATPAVCYYNTPNLGTMWQLGATGEEHPTLGYARPIKSVWFAVRQSKNVYVKCGTPRNGYFPITAVEGDQTLFYMEKANAVAGTFVEGYCFYYDVSQSIPAKYYLNYDAAFGFKRAYAEKPSYKLTITQWERKTGTDLAMSVTPNPVVFDHTDLTGKQLPVQLTLVQNADRFINKRDNTEQFYIQQGTTITDQETIRDLISSTSVKWSSTGMAGGSSIHTYSKTAPHSFVQTRTLMTLQGSSLTFNDGGGYYYTTVTPENIVAREIYDQNGNPVDHQDYLRIQVKMKDGKTFMDSVPVIRRTFHDVANSPLTISNTPGDQTVNTAATTLTFTVSARFQNSYRTLYADGRIHDETVGQTITLDLPNLPTIQEVAWQEYCTDKVDAESGEPYTECTWVQDGDTTYSDTVMYTVQGSDWMTVTLQNRNTFNVNVSQNTGAEPRFGSIRYTFTYKNGDNYISATQTIYITQQGTNASASITFEHNGTAKPDMTVQDVHEQVTTLYAIPGAELQLPLRQDMYGWYRWYAYESEQYISILNLTWNKAPRSQRGEFYNINNDDTYARGKFDYAPNFTAGQPTDVASVNVPRDFEGGKVACDVSEYTNYVVDWNKEGQKGSVKEPTLSYRQVFDIRPASEQADRMEMCLKGASGAQWMDKHDIMAPAGRVVKFQPTEKCVKGTNQDSELGYVYYFNIKDPDNIGKKSSVDPTSPYAYMRIGLARDTTIGYPDTYTAHRISNSYFLNRSDTVTREFFLVAPAIQTGYVLGRNGTNPITTQPATRFATQADIDAYVQSLADHMDQNMAFALSVKCFPNNKIRIRTENNKDYHLLNSTVGNNMDWQAIFNDYDWKLSSATNKVNDTYSDGKRLVDNVDQNSLFFMATQKKVIVQSDYVYFARSFERKEDKECIKWKSAFKCEEYRYSYEYAGRTETAWNTRNALGETDITKGTLEARPEYVWQFYAIDTIHPAVPSESFHYEEHAKWYISTNKGASWTELGTNGNGVVNNDGSLDYSFPNAADSVIIKLESEHFQLGYYVVNFYDPAKQVGPSTAALLTEDEIAQDYEPILDFNSLYTPAGTTSMTVLNQHLEWGQSELGFHYPQGQIDGTPIFNQTLPAQGEYCLLNKYEKDGKVIESRSGAENGVMLYVNSAKAPTTFWDFTYPQPTCADQDIYFTCYVRNPHNSECHIRLFLEGEKDGNWELIANINSGLLPANSGWQQILIPLTANIQGQGYNSYHFKFRITGATGTGETGILLDKIRMIGAKRPAAVYQSNMTCGEDDVFAVSRIVYPNLSEEVRGARMCYQISYKNSAGEYTPMEIAYMPNGENGYFIDAFYPTEYQYFLSQDDNKNYGTIVVPDPDYDPSLSGTPAGQSVQLKALLDQIQGAETRTPDFINETARVFNSVEDLCAATKNWGEKGGVRGMGKGYIKEKIAGVDTWVMYVVMKLDPDFAADYRLRMTPLVNATTQPYFLDASCSAERFFSIKEMVSLSVDGNTVSEEISSFTVPGNTAHTVRAIVNITEGQKNYSGSSKFDVIRLPEEMRNYENLSDAALANAEAAFKAMHNYSVDEVERAINIFHNPDEANPNREGNRAWEYVTPEDFMYAGISEEAADSVYAILKSLNDNAKTRFGVDEHTFTIGSDQDVYCWVRPIPASATYVKAGGSSTGADTTIAVVVCDNNQWLEFHAGAVPHQLRFGNDPKTDEEKNNIPIIRATRTQANTMLPVRVSEITNDKDHEVILGWDSTRLVATNDPRWDGTAMTFRYAQDRILQADDYKYYYQHGDTIKFTPVNDAHIALLNKDRGDGKNQWNVPVSVHPGYQTPNNFTLEDGYWYRFQTTMMNLALSPYVDSDTLSGLRMGDAFFELYVIPDTLQWMPSNEEGANYWNDDRNWRAVVNGQPTGVTRVPLGESQVIIDEQKGEHLYPIVDTDLHGNNDFGFKTATCRDILFRPNTRIKGQELLDYNRCFIDRYYYTGQWVGFSPALKFTHTGDMYTPADQELDAKSDFNPVEFDTEHNRKYAKENLGVTTFSREAPYAYYQSFWNTSMPEYSYNYSYESVVSHTESNAQWLMSNTVDYHYQPGNGYAVVCFDPSDEEGHQLLYRLPKQETQYSYYRSNGQVAQTVTINRPTFDKQIHNMSYDKDTLAAETTGGLTITLTNSTADSKDFLFGNPSMGMIDVWKFVADNHLEEVVQFVSNSTWVSHTKAENPHIFLSPHDIMLVTAKESGASLQVTLKPEHITIITQIEDEPAAAPMRNAVAQRGQGRLTIMAENAGYFGRTVLMESANADFAVKMGEDAVAVTSGTGEGESQNFGSFHTAVNIHTLCQDKALTTDIRPSVNYVPLGFTWMKDMQGYYDATTRLYFSVQGTWTDPLWLVDVITGDSLPIVDGGSVVIATPEANQQNELATTRYYIRGHAGTQVDPPIEQGGGLVTKAENLYNNKNNQVVIFDMLGREVLTYPNANVMPAVLPLNTGVYMVHNGEEVERRIVK
ncbi:MAG: T9SS type A sorting domain-containing protein [Paludibacteraceae bacterium]|nr:T9SS type A sorting domain-containing protein [Paludibacteraceae bacterium]